MELYRSSVEFVGCKLGLPNYGYFSSAGTPMEWVPLISRARTRKEKRKKLGMLIRLIWKERNRRISEHN
jgi:hypothetical protein